MTEFLIQTIWLIPFYGLLGAVLTLPWSLGIIQRTGPRPAAYFNLLMTFCAYVHGLFVFNAVWNHPAQQLIIHWFRAADLDLTFALEISAVNVGAMELVTGLSLLAQLFALGYMEKDWALARFFALMGFFEAAMSGLTLSDSLLLSYCLLELLTVSTYLLVGFWYAQPLVITAARDAFLTKRVGDVLLLMGVVALSTLAGSTNFSDLYTWAETAHLSPVTATLLGLALIAGPVGKCAQFPLHLWLDEAMEAPSPASVLRNSLVVSCGAYLLIKMQPILALSPIVMATLIAIGSLTAIGSSLVAIAQIDIKRALSHSTSAYLGLVFVAVGIQQIEFALMLILAHAIAKALLFMSIGCVIANTNSQDVTETGGLGKTMPITASAFLVGAVGLVGLFPLGGFWAMQQGVDCFWTNAPWLIGVLLWVNALTAFNLTRVFRLVFLGQPQVKARRAPEVGWMMALPMVALNVMTFSVPWMLRKLMLLPPILSLNPVAEMLLVASGLLGFGAGAMFPFKRIWLSPVSKIPGYFHNMLAYDFYADLLYRSTVVFAVTQLSKFSAWCDRYIFDGVANLIGFAAIFSGQSLKYVTSGASQSYVFTILVSLGVLVVMVSWGFLQGFSLSTVISFLF
jgi:NAD(P)H-quinone oxidoreductase subunit 5